ncbi:hypothetical protein PR048_024080 [Dryococelus australis]|uniref:Uncharacterized protein n=1 Tax=Dryococelus australis TaxID=614101 RepID=A0ABQ9GVZ8_9NEOP|nr:hypothetical protein PR048_024080 [Dryococelus australis]
MKMFSSAMRVCRCRRVFTRQLAKSFADRIPANVSGAEIINDNSNEEKTDTLDGHESTKNSDSKIDSLISEVDACIISEENPRSALEPPSDGTDLTDLGPYFKPTFNFAAYINKSPSLQELVKLGVDLHKLEHKKGVPEFILTLDFERDMKEHIRYEFIPGS